MLVIVFVFVFSIVIVWSYINKKRDASCSCKEIMLCSVQILLLTCLSLSFQLSLYGAALTRRGTLQLRRRDIAALFCTISIVIVIVIVIVTVFVFSIVIVLNTGLHQQEGAYKNIMFCSVQLLLLA